MKWSPIAFIPVVALMAIASPAPAALSPAACSILQQAVQVSPNLQGALNNSGCPGTSIGASGGANPAVEAAEPAALLTVGLGLLGAGLLLRRRPSVEGG